MPRKSPRSKPQPERPAAPAPQPDSGPIVYYFDGYHGGIKGGMAPGSWRAILEGLRRRPDWNISLEIEAISWTALRRRDPAAYDELRRFLNAPRNCGRIEIVSGSFAQPFCWAIDGESNIRQLQHGLRIHREHFPRVRVDTYAVQEPCFTSCLPGILRSLGFVRASLKNNTVFFGCVAGRDAEVVNWVGPDGSALPAVPRNTFDTRVSMWDLRSGYAHEDYAREAAKHGIAHPTGCFFQDCGWPAAPWHDSPGTRRVTLREFFSTVAAPASENYHLTQDDVEVALPWGEKTVHQLAAQVRAAENRVLVAEKMAVLARLWGRRPWPARALREAWEQLMLAQHHDGWACCSAAIPWRRKWSWQVDAESWASEEICGEITAASAECLSACVGGSSGTWVRLFNTTGAPRTQVAEVPVAANAGTRGFRVFDSGGREVPAQTVPARRYHFDDSLNSATVLFPAETPAMGFASYRVESVKTPPPPISDGIRRASVRTRNDGLVAIDTDLYRIIVDPARGGVLTSLFSRELRREFIDRSSPRLFNEYRGYLKTGQHWISSANEPASVEILESGPLRVRVRIVGKVGEIPVWTTMTVTQGQRPIDFAVRFHFAEDTWIGDPEETKDVRNSFTNSCLDDRWKLQAHFPAALKGQTIHKNAAFDVCQSRLTDTFYRNFNELKHNVILNWVDVVDKKGTHGLALFSDRTAGYAHGPDHPLSLILGWGGRGFSWWGDCPLRGLQESRYAIVPHAGRWDTAGLWHESVLWNEPLLAQRFTQAPPPGGESRSLLSVDEKCVEVSSLVIEGRDLVVRLFNAHPDVTNATLRLAGTPARVVEVELDGRERRELTTANVRGGIRAKVPMPPFGVRTLRVCGVA